MCLQLGNGSRELALFNLEIDSKPRGCDRVWLCVCDMQRETQPARCAIVMQPKAQQLVQFELSEQTRYSVSTWIEKARLQVGQFLNFQMGDEGRDRIKASFGGNYPRLTRIKAKYDPHNFFRVNHNIQPA